MIIEWMRATIPRWGYYLLGPLLMLGLTFALASLLKRALPARFAAVVAGALSYLLLTYGHRYAAGGSTGLLLAGMSAAVAAAWWLRREESKR